MSLWFEGDIAQAVNKAKGLGAFFVVFIEGKNDTSVRFANFFNDENIFNELKTTNFVAIKIEDQSVAHSQFSAIYPQNPVPSVYIIDKHGKPVEIISGDITDKEFLNKIQALLEQKGIKTKQEDLSHFLQHEQSSGNQASSSVSQNLNADVKPEENVKTTSEVAPDGEEILNAEEKIRRAQELIRLKQEQKKREEEENEKLKEIERRKTGQNVQQMKKWQKDEELKQMVEEREKEKRENQQARDRVLAQIAQDRAERAAKFSNQPSTTQQPTAPASQSSPKSNIARLQFRLPDGTSHTQEFAPNDLLNVVHDYIRNNINLSFTNYTLSTTFPRREFTTNDNNQTLLDLQLVPNAVVLILPVNQGIVQRNSVGSIGNMFWWVFSPLFQLYSTITGYLLGRREPQNISRTESSSSVKRSLENNEAEKRLPKKKASESTVIRRQGNIHRLRDRPDSDDENNTWNGNSTQQM